MPTDFLYIDTNFPKFSGDDKLPDRVAAIQNYLFVLVEQLRYSLANLDTTNWNQDALGKYGLTLTEPILIKVGNAEKAITQIKIDTDGIAAQVKNLEGDVSQIKLEADGLTLTVKNLNDEFSAFQFTVDGLLVTDGQGITRVKGSSIETGSLNLTGAIKFTDLNSETQGKINTANSNAQSAVTAASNAQITANSASQTANEAYGTVNQWVYPGTTYIDGGMIQTGTIEASILRGGVVELLDYRGVNVGSMTITNTSTGTGLEISTNRGGIRIVSGGNTWFESGSGWGFGTTSSGFVVKDDCVPEDNNAYRLGLSNLQWAELYVASGTISTSDAKRKKNVSGDLTAYETFFDSLRPVSYQFTDGTSGRTHIGMISQEVEQQLFESGLTDMDFAGFIKSPVLNEEKEETGEFNYALRYDEFIGLLIHEVQSLKKRVKTLEERMVTQ